MNFKILVAAALLASSPSMASTLVDFESTPAGLVAEGTNIGGIVFTSGIGAGLEVGDFTPQTIGKGLVARNDFFNSSIFGFIAGGATQISLAFGNDDPSFSAPGDLATLRLFNGAALLDTVTVVMNRDDIMNQSIGWIGNFDTFEFIYTDAAGRPTVLFEVIDNVAFNAVPEPATWAMLIAGFGLVGFSARRRRDLANA